MKKLAMLLGLACVALGALAGGGSASPAAGAAPVMTGLHNPRGLAFDNHGSLYVAEAGQGGTAPCAVFSDGMTKCYGADRPHLAAEERRPGGRRGRAAVERTGGR